MGALSPPRPGGGGGAPPPGPAPRSRPPRDRRRPARAAAAGGRGDWLSVGDVAYFDEEAFFYICDRKNDMIISGGMNIYPAEIEAALDQHPAGLDVAALGS